MTSLAAWPAWAVMWGIALAIFAACKVLTFVEARAARVAASRARCVGYLFAWSGLDARAFLGTHVPRRAPDSREWLLASAKVLLGLGVLVSCRWVLPDHPLVRGWVGMIGLVVALHFGLFHLLSCAWRSAGVDAAPLMDSPLTSTSVSEFWGRRWNVAFRDLTHRFLFRPLQRRMGASAAIAVGFLVSGLIHEAVISLPAGAGYGRPTLFFLLQAGALFFERSAAGRRMGLGKGAPGWAFTMLLLLATVGLLLHPPFVLVVIVPFLGAIGLP